LKPALIAAAQSNGWVPASQSEQPPLLLGAGEALLSLMIHQAELIQKRTCSFSAPSVREVRKVREAREVGEMREVWTT